MGFGHKSVVIACHQLFLSLNETTRGRCQLHNCSSRIRDSTTLKHNGFTSSGNVLPIGTQIIKIGLVTSEKNVVKNGHFSTKNENFYRLVDFYRTDT